jgi:hypothetical protein
LALADRWSCGRLPAAVFLGVLLAGSFPFVGGEGSVVPDGRLLRPSSAFRIVLI